MSDEIKPALTPDEWSELRADRGVLWVRKYEDGSGIEIFDELRWSGGSAAPDLYHALAALALHGQAFGFTHDDVTLLRGAASYLGGDSTRGDWWRVRLNGLADRIVALLPPRDAGS